uniref:Uncharacterized protein n=1 Tax=Anguilla anguilla TaxID=7936 RepID=A0A0E9VNS4_ANGAN
MCQGRYLLLSSIFVTGHYKTIYQFYTLN